MYGMWSQILLLAVLMLFLYPFVLFPAILRLMPRKRPTDLHEATSGGLPAVALVICALNEEKVIGDTLRHAVALNYPKEKLRILVISDGSTDHTADVARQFAGAGVQLIEQPARRGKVTNLNDVIPSLPEQIVVSMDANVCCHPDAILQLSRRFQDPCVGCASAKVIVTDTPNILDASQKNFFSLEWFLQEQGSNIYSMAGVDGALYGFRRELFRRYPNDTVIEDFVIAIGIVRQGMRVVFEPYALASETGPASIAEEFRRKVRIAAGAAQALVRGNAFPRSAPWRFWFIFVSHKLLRWLSPIIGMVALLIAVASWRQPLSQVVWGGFLLVAVAAALRLIVKRQNRVLDAPFYFLLGQTSLALGLAKGFTGAQSVLWAKANR